MMSPKQWLALLCFYISYLFFGASVFYHIEHSKELENRATQLQERISVNELLVKYASPEDEKIQNQVLKTLSGYCGRPVTNYTLDQYPVDFEWTFYHSFWFSFIVCSTVGYGNSSPHDQPGQAFCILYALIGLPVNAFVLAYLGEFFTKTFTGIYKRYKGHEYAKSNSHDATEKFGMIGTITMLLVPGIAFFIFLPACLFTYFENWPYVRSVYYSFVTLTTIGFGDFVPTFQDGQARTFGTYFAFYQTFIVFWNFIGVGYFIMIIGFIAKGMRSKRIARLEHQLSMNIKETQHRIWAGFNKDVNFLRRILNEANMMKFKPVYSDSSENNSIHSLPRSSSCPEISVHRNEYLRNSRKRTYSENCGQQLRSSSSMTLNRALSDGDLNRIDRKKTFEGSGSLFQNNDLVSNLLTALSSIRPTHNEDVQSCLELGMDGGTQLQNESSYEWTWDGSNSQQIKEYIHNKTNKNSFETSSVQDDLEMQKPSRKRSFMSNFNPFKDRLLSQENRRFSVASQDSNVRKYLENTSNGRGSRISLSSQLTCENMQLLENTTIADLIRAVEGNESKTNYSPATPLLGEHKERSKMKIGTTAPTGVRRRSLRPTHDYTTIFTSQNMKKSSSSSLNRPFPINTTSVTTPKRPRKRIRSTSSSISTVPEHYSSIQSLPMFYRTMSLRPAPISKGPPETTVNTGAFSQMPMITVQAPNVSKRNILWHPEYQDESTLKNELRRKRADSK